MSISQQEVLKVAHLARLALPVEKVASYTQVLSSILDLVAQMNSVDTGAVQPLLNPLDAVQRLRPDSVTESNRRDIYQGIAPRVEDGLYLVPKVIE